MTKYMHFICFLLSGCLKRNSRGGDDIVHIATTFTDFSFFDREKQMPRRFFFIQNYVRYRCVLYSELLSSISIPTKLYYTTILAK